ncbi:MAG: choice-of-anchor L domain-containing protein [Bacteroidota bacterium]
MKKILTAVCLVLAGSGFCQISIDESFSAQDMVEDILINSPCAEVSSITSRTGTNFSEPNGIAVFNANGSDFPFQNGIILSTGDVRKAPGPNNSIPNSDGTNAWPGDEELELITNVEETFNASYLKFRFIPLSNRISFDFLFASEEYNQNFECFFSDAFAFILTNVATGESTNLAVLPGTGIPVSVTNIHPEVEETSEGSGCPAKNEIYFDTYNFLPFRDPDESPTDFNGQTVVLKALGEVVQGEAYTIKLVVADAGDTQVDTAVFIGGNTFNVGIELGNDLTIENGGAPCEDSPGVEIGVTPDDSGSTSYQWFVLDPVAGIFQIIPGADESTLFVEDPGTYKLEGTLTSGCVDEDEIVVEFAPIPVAVPLEDYVICAVEGDTNPIKFDLGDPDLIDEILNGQNPEIFKVSFHETLEDAQNANNPLPQFYENTSNPQTVYVRITAGSTICHDITTLDLVVSVIPFIPLEESYRLCVDEDGNVIEEETGEPSPVVLDTSLNPNDYNFQWFFNNVPIDGAMGPSYVPQVAGAYKVRIEDLKRGCTLTLTTQVIEASPPFEYDIRVLSDFFATNNIVEVSAEGLGTYVFGLDGGSFQEMGRFENISTGPHVLVIKDLSGCGSVRVPFNIVGYPRLLTPNNDGFNDTWNIFDLAEIDPSATIYIFDRFGKLLRAQRPTNAGWDGTFQGNPLPSSDYWFRVDYLEDGQNKMFRGHFTLKR